MPPLSEAAVSKSFRVRKQNLERRSRQKGTQLTRPKLERVIAANAAVFSNFVHGLDRRFT